MRLRGEFVLEEDTTTPRHKHVDEFTSTNKRNRYPNESRPGRNGNKGTGATDPCGARGLSRGNSRSGRHCF
jgi:hypothetical protein